MFFFRRALSAGRFDVDLRLVESVSRARDYLEGRGEFSDRSYYRLPDLIVTDFKMNGQTGVEFVRWLKSHPDYKELPVVMYSGTALPQDRAAALQSGVLAFFSKSGEFPKTCETVAAILKFLHRNN